MAGDGRSGCDGASVEGGMSGAWEGDIGGVTDRLGASGGL